MVTLPVALFGAACGDATFFDGRNGQAVDHHLNSVRYQTGVLVLGQPFAVMLRVVRGKECERWIKLTNSILKINERQ